MRIIVLAVISGLTCGNVFAADVPDYIGYSQIAQENADLAYSATSCTRLGFMVDKDKALVSFQQDMIDAIKNGIDSETAAALTQSARESRKADLDLISANIYLGADTELEKEAALVKYLEWWQDHCAALVKNPRFTSIIRWGTDEEIETAYAKLAKGD